MDIAKAELKGALHHQLRLMDSRHKTVSLDDLNATCNDIRALDKYDNHRLAATAFFLSSVWRSALSSRSRICQSDYPITLPALNVMDAYVSKCATDHKALACTLGNLANIRAACLCLSLKMYGVLVEIDMREMSRVTQDWPCVARDVASTEDDIIYVPSSKEGIKHAELAVIAELRGRLFLGHQAIVARTLTRLVRPSREGLSERVVCAMTKWMLKASLCPNLRWRVPSWQLALAAFVLSLAETEEETRAGRAQTLGSAERAVAELLEDVKPGQCTARDFLSVRVSLERSEMHFTDVRSNARVRKALEVALKQGTDHGMMRELRGRSDVRLQICTCVGKCDEEV